MAYWTLADHFAYFFNRLNPSATFEETAAREYSSIKGLIEKQDSPAAVLSPRCFLQGSYKQDTAIYTINDVDVVALCRLWQPGSGAVRSWNRDEIFRTLAAPLLGDRRYRDKVRYGPTSMCIKVDLGIKVEILPAVYKAGNSDFNVEPFRIYRPEKADWDDGYARYHQRFLTDKNGARRTEGNFIPAIKVLKHLRSRFSLDAVSFHLECLLYRLPDEAFRGAPADYIPTILGTIAADSADVWYGRVVKTPCGERDIFVSSEWTKESWQRFHASVVKWAPVAREASRLTDKNEAIRYWQWLLSDDLFPQRVS